MPTIFTRASASAAGFSATSLGPAGASITAGGELAAQTEANTATDKFGDSRAAAIVRGEGGGSPSGQAPWYVISAPGVNIVHNGVPLQATGIAELNDRDELVFHGPHGTQRLFFTSKEAPAPEALPDDLSADACCPRCQLPLSGPPPGLSEDELSETPVIRCPTCGTLYHSQRCWSYSDTCIVCGGSTVDHKMWHPADLG